MRRSLRQRGREATPYSQEPRETKSRGRGRVKIWDEQTRPRFTNETITAVYAAADSIIRESDRIRLYQCNDGQYYPRKGDRVDFEPFATIDHIKDWHTYVLDNVDADYDDNYTQRKVREAYNDQSNLRLMSISANSSKGGPGNVYG